MSLLWQLIGFPYIKIVFRELVDTGWAAGRMLTSVFVALVIFFLANIGISINTNFGLAAVVVFFSIISLIVYKKNRFSLKKFLIENWRFILIEEILFLGGVVFMGTMRGFWPNLDNLEKFMDFGFINQYLLNAKLPAPDMWYAGGHINYYSFGHFWSSILIRSWQVLPTTGFNLMLAYSFGLDLAIVFSVTINLLKKYSMKFKVMGGIISTGLVIFGGNTHILWYLVRNNGLIEVDGNVPYWYAMATRFIENTIHEFPSYTFTIGDLHAHLIDLPIVLVFLLVFFQWSRTINEKLSDIYLEILLGLLLGIMVMTNTWDSLIYAMLLLIYCFFRVITRKTHWKIYFKGFAVIAGMAILVSSPWWWSYQIISQGISLVTIGSPLWKLAVVWSGQILFGILAWKLFPKNIALRSVIILSFLLILIPEIVFVKDIYPFQPRANTMFKLTYQTFVMLSICGGVVTIKTFNRIGWAMCLILVLMTTGLLVFPFTSYANFYSHFSNYYGLANEDWLVGTLGDKYGALQYLKVHKNGTNLLEYPGESFSSSNSLSVFSGVPDVLGWRDHEWLWRGSKELVDQRAFEVRTIYEFPASKETSNIIKKYKVGWIIVGQEERTNYDINYSALKNLGKIVWEDKENVLIQIESDLRR